MQLVSCAKNFTNVNASIMAWVKIKRTVVSSDEPMISINNQRFVYNVVFTKIAEIEKYNYVSYFINEEERKIGFEFKSEESADSFTIVKQRSYTYSQSAEVFRIPWISKVSKEKDINKFKPIREGRRWVITLMPVFEFSVKRDNPTKIHPEFKGIYRYLDQGRIVYIGKGNIRDRLQQPQRKDWKFDTVEFSLIEDVDRQFEWELFWLERFKEENEGYLPAYNSISGVSARGE